MPAAAAGAYGDAVDYGVVATQSNYGVATQLNQARRDASELLRRTDLV